MISSGQTPTLYGSQVTYIGYYPTLENPVTIPNTVTVGPGIEFPVGFDPALDDDYPHEHCILSDGVKSLNSKADQIHR